MVFLIPFHQHQSQGFGVELMFQQMHSVFEAFERIARANIGRKLGDDAAGIKRFRHPMHATAMPFFASGQNPGMGI